MRLALLSFILGCALGPVALAHDPAHEHHSVASPSAAGAKVVLHDAPLLDASGKRLRLAPDVIGERIAVVNFIYTRCTTVCPVASATFQQLQGRLAAALGRDVVLVSISVDPQHDTPERLREAAGRYRAGESWVWLTGAKSDVDNVLKGFGAYTPNFEDHPAMVLIGDARAGTWTRYFGFPSVEELAARVETMQAARAGKGRVASYSFQ